MRTVSPLSYATLRIGLASLVLLRTTDLGRGLVTLDHHRWVDGLEYHPSVERTVDPALFSPLLHGVPAPSDELAGALVIARTALAVMLLLGLFSRASAAGLAAIGVALVLLDRYRYFHHLHLLWMSCAWLALAPSGNRLSVMRLVRPPATEAPAWPLNLIRLHVMAVYLASGLAKLNADWLSGRTLGALTEVGLVRPPFDAPPAYLTAVGICVLELGLPALLAWRRSRLAAVALAVALHVAIDSAMMVSTFGATMVLLLTAFLPWDREDMLRGETCDADRLALDARARGVRK